MTGHTITLRMDSISRLSLTNQHSRLNPSRER
jgi:hypothetical protein